MRKYQLPGFLEKFVDQKTYDRWLHRKTVAHIRRDRNRSTTAKNEEYKIGTTILAINIRRTKKPPLRADVQDPAGILKSVRVHESGKQHSNKGYRYFEFGVDDKDVEFAKEQFTKIINFHLQSHQNSEKNVMPKNQ